MPKKLVIANWKMNGSHDLAMRLTRASGDALARAAARAGTNETAPDVVLCPPFPYLFSVAGILGAGVQLGAQDVAVLDPHAKGAQTGDVAPAMLAEIGCTYVIVGHSERRLRYGESNAVIQQKAAGVLAAGMTPIICVGESAGDRQTGRAFDVVRDQILHSVPPGGTSHNIVLAYEPVWAIGAGVPATDADIIAMHEFMCRTVQESLAPVAGLRMVYGGSVKATNAASLLALPHVDGVLVGGASLKVDEFGAIVAVAH